MVANLKYFEVRLRIKELRIKNLRGFGELFITAS
jgi:hypothetical protein